MLNFDNFHDKPLMCMISQQNVKFLAACQRRLVSFILTSHIYQTIDSFHSVSVHAPNSLVPRYLREITLEGATFIRLPMYYTTVKRKINLQINIRLIVNINDKCNK